MRVAVVLCAILWGGWVSMAAAGEGEAGTQCSSGTHAAVQCIRPGYFVHDVCQALEAFSTAQGLDPGFFARLIWQESRFDPNALSHAGAQGIAQFIPSTAALRGLIDAYNPALALEYSAEYLGVLVQRYGNPGLAAVAYNGGERRADGLVAQTGGLARETIDYVQIITGLTAEAWRDAPPEAHDFRLVKDKPFREACFDLARKSRLTKYPRPEPALRPWGAQLAFGTTRDAARAAFKRRTRACRKLVADETIDLVRVRNRVSGKRGYVMARISRDSHEAAQRLCDRLRGAGCTCAVYRNR